MPANLLTLLIAVGFIICWSSGFVGGRLAVESTTPVLALFVWRFGIASLLTGLWWSLHGLRGMVGQREVCRNVLIEAGIGCLTMGGYLLGVILAIRYGVSAGVTALIAALQPLLAAAMAGRWLGERLALRGWAGMGIATVGVAMCVLDDVRSGADVPFWAYALPLLSVISVTLGSVFAVRKSTALPMAATLTAQLIAATLVFTIAALVAGQSVWPAPKFDQVTLAAITWLIVLSSLGGYGFFVASLRRLGVTQTSALVYLTPPVTLVWAALMFEEYPGAWGFAGMGVAIAGVVLAILNDQKPIPSAGGRACPSSPGV